MIVVMLSMQGLKALRFYKKKILIHILKINEGITDLERHEGD